MLLLLSVVEFVLQCLYLEEVACAEQAVLSFACCAMGLECLSDVSFLFVVVGVEVIDSRHVFPCSDVLRRLHGQFEIVARAV